MRIPVSYRIPKYTDKQIRTLAEKHGLSQSGVICIAIDRLSQKESADADQETKV